MKKHILLLLLLTALGACTDEPPMQSLGLESEYRIARMSKLSLEPAYTGEAYRWTVNGVEVATSKDYIFLAQDEGEYRLTFEVVDSSTPYFAEMTVTVLHEEVEYSPYISRVYEYRPAPGQFINEMPKYEAGDTETDMVKKAEESISGTNDVMISLGGFGGYVTFGFDHTVINVPGEYDFRIWGNAFYELTNPDKKGGSAEAGIVSVSYDVNCNGIPDDPWYELAGSAYGESEKNYRITYYRPDPEREIVSDGKFLTDLNYIVWTDSDGLTSTMPKNSFHSQNYYPDWLVEDEISFSGTLLPPNAVDTSGSGSYYVLYSFDWGYADNHPNDYADLNSFDIGWAVDEEGNRVDLPGIDFVRVYTGLNQYCGWIGETSTEISRAADLHIKDPITNIPNPL